MAQAISDAGIHQFLTKPSHPEQLLTAARNGARLFHLARHNERMALEMRFLASSAQSKLDKRRAALRDGLGLDTLLRGPQSPTNATIEAALHCASFDIPVLLTGEPGTGSARLARAMHFGSLRSDRPFHALSLAGLSDDLAAIKLFGPKRGVLPGGVNRIGLAQKADRGTLLKGIEHASPALELALWRLIDEGTFSPTGGQETLTTNLRLIAGSGTDRSAKAILTATGTLEDRSDLIEMRILREPLTRHSWNKSRAAVELGLSRVGLRAKLDRYGITDPSRRATIGF